MLHALIEYVHLSKPDEASVEHPKEYSQRVVMLEKPQASHTDYGAGDEINNRADLASRVRQR